MTPAATKSPIKILFVCLGNICRSPMAQAVFQGIIDDASLTEYFLLDSAGTSANHEGEAYHRETQRVCRDHSLILRGASRPVLYPDLEEFDYIVAMDSSNYQDLLALDAKGMHEKKISRLLDFSSLGPAHDFDVPDPYFGGPKGFDQVYEIILDGCLGLFRKIKMEKKEFPL